MLAAITRARVFTGELPPTGTTSRSCSTRRSLTCSAALVSLISSRKTVPSPACSKMPRLLAMALVKAPLTWPNNSDSSSVSVSAPQLTATNGEP
ncbi:MAG TPA: hypothetical protein VFY40_18135 [Blastocatellia bacterium]|nr:hypothetical protein [Blastocatellia bacterium]